MLATRPPPCLAAYAVGASACAQVTFEVAIGDDGREGRREDQPFGEDHQIRGAGMPPPPFSYCARQHIPAYTSPTPRGCAPARRCGRRQWRHPNPVPRCW